MNHIIISRVNLHMRLDPHKYKETELWKRKGWNEERIQLLNDWCRASLRKQSNQNFTFVSLWQKGYMAKGGELGNEIKIEIENTGTYDDEPLDYQALWGSGNGKITLNFADQIADKIKKRFKAPLLVTNCDCDDALKYDFVELLQAESLKHNGFVILDMQTRLQYNIKTGVKGKKSSRRPSPFLSCLEPEIRCVPTRYNHSVIPVDIPLVKVTGLSGLQTLNSSNMFVKGTGDSANFNLEDYR